MKQTEKYIRTRVEEEIHRINRTLKREIAVKITEEVIKAALIETRIHEIDEAGDALPIKQRPWDLYKGFAEAEFKLANETRKKVVFDASKHLKAALLKDVQDTVEEVLTEQMEKGPILQPNEVLNEKRDKRIAGKIKAGNKAPAEGPV
jgi:hypothetical protein